MKFYKLNDYGDGCHKYAIIFKEDLADHVGDFFTEDDVVDLYAVNGQNRGVSSYNYIYVSGEWDAKHIKTLVAMYKKKVGKNFPSTITMNPWLNDHWWIPQHIHDAVAVEFLKEFSKKYTRVGNSFLFKDKRPLSDFECVKLVSKIVTANMHQHISTTINIRSTDNTVVGLENVIRIKIACGITLDMFTTQLDKTLAEKYQPTHPQLKSYRKQIVDVFKRLKKDKKLVQTNV